MDSDQELKSLKRGLKAMTLINTAGSITISELSRALDLPRTTAERVLMTLLSEGYVARDPQTKRFFLTDRVRALSGGYSDESWIAHVAAPMLFETTGAIGWPLCIATPAGEYIVALVTAHVFGGDLQVNRGIATVVAAGALGSAAFLVAALRPYRRAMAECNTDATG